MTISEARKAMDHARELMKEAYIAPFPGGDFDWFEKYSQTQTVTFYTELLPLLHRLVSRLPYGAQLSVLDAGAGSGAGSDFLARLHATPFLGSQFKVSAFDLYETYQHYSQAAYPLVDYRIGDIMKLEDNSFDIALCSHTIEHFVDPTDFIKKIASAARYCSIFYAPFEEADRLEGHLRSITLDYVKQFNPEYVEIRESAAWRHPKDPVSKCIVFVLRGRDFDTLEFGKTEGPLVLVNKPLDQARARSRKPSLISRVRRRVGRALSGVAARLSR